MDQETERTASAAPWRRPLARLAAAAGVLVVALGFGITTAQFDGTLGPHLARYEMTVDHEVRVDLGPLGTIAIDSPLPAVLGVRVVVREIPAEFTAMDDAATIAALSEDLQRYLQLFSAPDVTVEAAARGLVGDAVRRAGMLAVALVALGLALGRALGAPRRAELAAVARRRGGALAAGSAIGLALASTLTASGPSGAPGEPARLASSVFDGTPFEGARLTGRLAGLIDTYGGDALAAYRQNEEFYAGASDAVAASWRRQAESEAARRATPETETVDALLISDLHCNVGMAQVIRRVAELSEVDLVLNAGDSTVDGTAVESYCVQTFADAVPPGVAYVVADGNHDSAQTSAQEAAAGATVLDGRVVEVAGLRILGDRDPNETRVGVGTRPAGEESAAEAGRRLADTACQDGDVDLLLVHTPVVGIEALRQGCVPAQLSGHLHTRQWPHRIGEGVRYISGSSAGALLDEPTVGPLRGTAELTVFRFDPAGHLRDYRLIQVDPSGDAWVGPRITWPTEWVPQPRPGEPV